MPASRAQKSATKQPRNDEKETKGGAKVRRGKERLKVRGREDRSQTRRMERMETEVTSQAEASQAAHPPRGWKTPQDAHRLTTQGW